MLVALTLALAGLAAGLLLRDIFGGLVQKESEDGSRLNEEIGAVLGGVTLLIFGAVLLGPTLKHVSWQIALYAVMSLTIVRMLPVAVALIGSGLRVPTVAFIGWFGPRGLASVVLALVILEDDRQLPHIETLVLTTLTTVILSIIVHGLSAAPLSGRYGAWAATLPPGSPELGPAPEVRTRRSAPHGRISEPEDSHAVSPRAGGRP